MEVLWPKLTAGFTSAMANSLETEYNKCGVDGDNANIGYISFLIWVSENVKYYLIGINASRKAIKIARLPLSTLFSFLFSLFSFLSTFFSARQFRKPIMSNKPLLLH